MRACVRVCVCSAFVVVVVVFSHNTLCKLF